EPGMSIVCAIVPLSPASRLFPYTTLFRSGRDSARFLAAGARRSFWLRTKHGFLAEGLPLLRTALGQIGPDPNGEMIPLILESNSLLQFLKPSLYFAVLDPAKEDFKDSARVALDRADALIVRCSPDLFSAASPA